MKDQNDLKPSDIEKIENASNAALDQSLSEISPHTRQSLIAAREEALKAAERQQNKWYQPWAWGGVITACLVVTVLINQPNDSKEIASIETESDFLLVSSISDEDMALIEDIEFAYWLAENEEFRSL